MQKIVVIMILVVEIFCKSNPNSYYLNIDFAYAKIIFAFAYDCISLRTSPKVHPSVSLSLLLPV